MNEETEDDILREIRAVREAFAAEHNYDVRAMVAALRAEDLAAGREVVTLPPRPAIRVGAAVEASSANWSKAEDASTSLAK
jgi:hypothetical protein